ncbi:MAG: GGDEF domain-containing protein [bacterium]
MDNNKKTKKGISNSGISNAELLFRSVVLFFIIVLVIIGIDFSNQMKNLQDISNSIEYTTSLNAKIQRIVRMEVTYENSDKLIDEVDSILDKLLKTNHFILITDDKMTNTFSSVIDSWESLKNEVYIARENGWHSTRILYAGETVFYSVERLSAEIMSYFLYLPTVLNLLQFFIFGVISLILIGLLIQCVKYISVIREQREQVKESYIDPATRVYNRAKCQELLLDTPLAGENSLFILCDLNNLKQVNDNLGHDCGDLLISSFAKSLINAQENIRAKAFIGRYGGDEFIIYFTNISLDELNDFYDLIQVYIHDFNKNEDRFKIQFAFGQVYAHEISSAIKVTDLFKLADERMYKNKIETKKK